jgi:nucleotide-binding universal stress UspA family protein
MINKILVGIDDSKHAERTLKRARELQKELDCDLEVFHSIKHKMLPEVLSLPIPAFAPNSVYRLPRVDYEKLKTEYIKRGKKILEKAKKIIGEDDKKVETHLVTDVKPEDYVITKSKEDSVDLVLLGQKGDQNAVEKLFGSVPQKVLEEAECDVMVVK